MKPTRSSSTLKGLAPPPSFSMFLAQVLHDIGLREGAPSTNPKHDNDTPIIVSICISSGRAARTLFWMAEEENSCAEYALCSVRWFLMFCGPGITDACARDIRPITASTLDRNDILLHAGGRTWFRQTPQELWSAVVLFVDVDSDLQ